jgi:UDP-glucose 4-epimerase
MRVLVTGGAGYIGSHTVRHLRERGYSVIVLDSMESGHRAAVMGTPLIEGNIKDAGLLAQIFADQAIDAVIHFAGYKAAGESMQRPERYFDNNVCGTQTLLQAMQAAGIRHLVFSSSCAVYGTPSRLPVSEADAVHPESPYGESKLMVEQMLRWYSACHGLNSVSLRYFNAAGAAMDATIGEDWTFASNLIPLVMKAALGRSQGLKVFGTDYPTPDGTAIRDYIHVVDLANAHVMALDFLQAHGQAHVFNLGTGRGASVHEVIATALRITGAAIPVEYVGRRPGDPAAINADTLKAREVLGWQPQYGLEEIIRTAWRWHAAHPDGYHRDVAPPSPRLVRARMAKHRDRSVIEPAPGAATT